MELHALAAFTHWVSVWVCPQSLSGKYVTKADRTIDRRTSM
jgi:hypothetical protein